MIPFLPMSESPWLGSLYFLNQSLLPAATRDPDSRYLHTARPFLRSLFSTDLKPSFRSFCIPRTVWKFLPIPVCSPVLIRTLSTTNNKVHTNTTIRARAFKWIGSKRFLSLAEDRTAKPFFCVDVGKRHFMAIFSDLLIIRVCLRLWP